MNKFIIRKAYEKDLQNLVTLSQKTFEETFSGDFKRPYKKKDLHNFFSKYHSYDLYKTYLNEARYICYVLEIDRRLEGYSLIGPCSLPDKMVSGTCGELKRIYINKKQQGLGYGKLLLEKSFNFLHSNFKDQWIGVWSGNLRAQKIYASYGFEKIGEYIFPVGTVLDREFILKKI